MGKQSWIMKLVALRFFLSGMEQSFVIPTAWYYVHSLEQTKFFLALVLGSYSVAAVVSGPLIGFAVVYSRSSLTWYTVST